MAHDFEWKRFWCPRGSTISLADGGFLVDPDSEWGKALNPDLLTFDRLADTPCLALLGEPGIGKSWALTRIRETWERPASDAEGTIFLDLRSFGSEDRLVQRLFQSAAFREWQQGNRTLHVFLDSLDECLLRIDNIAVILADELSRIPSQAIGRLKLRIACRTVPWPEILERALTGLFGDGEFAAFEMAPLRRFDVLKSVESSSIGNAGLFLSRIESLSAVPLAIKPVTLQFLLKTYQRDGDLPTTQIDLYEKGCRILCEEANESRLAAGRKGDLTANQRLMVASRIAAATQMTNKYAVCTGCELDSPVEDVPVDALAGGVEDDDAVTVTTNGILETLDTGLFSSRGLNRVGWAHQTYAEFLAARYCAKHGVPSAQLRTLIFHPAAEGQRLVPQLREIAGWLSVMRPDILEAVANADPEALLGTAAASLTDNQRAVVANAFLAQSDAGRAYHLRYRMRSVYGKLKHPALALQLQPFLRDMKRSVGARHVAIDIARATDLRELAADLADIALNAAEPKPLRIAAAATAAELGEADTKLRLKPLAFGEAGEDPDDELKGAGLLALWPGLISAEEMFSLISPPKQRNLHGLYVGFLEGRFIREMQTHHLPAALEWFCKQPPHRSGLRAEDRLMDSIVECAWNDLEAPGVAEALSLAILSRIQVEDALMSGFFNRDLLIQVRTDHVRRRRLLELLMPRIAERDLHHIFYTCEPLFVKDDFDWHVERILSGKNKDSEELEVKFVRYLVDTRSASDMRTLWFACQASQVVRQECEAFFSIPLDSDTARILRGNAEHEALSKKAKPPIEPSPLERIESDLVRIEERKLAEWIRLTLDLSLEPTSTTWSGDLEADLTSLPGWDAASTDTKARIVTAAMQYVFDGDPENEKWIETSNISYSAIAGFRALALLLTQDRDKLRSLSSAVWRKWVPILLRYPNTSGKIAPLQQQLLKRAYASVPQDVIEFLNRIIDRENAQFAHVFIADQVECCWDEILGTALLRKAGDASLKPNVVVALLNLVLKHDVPGSRDFAHSLLTLPPPGGELAQGSMLAAGQALICSTNDSDWDRLWPIIRNFPAWGKLLIESVSYGDVTHSGFLPNLSEAQLGELYAWMVINYPYRDLSDDRSDTDTGGVMAPADTAVMLRDGALENLKARTSFAACMAIRDVMQRLPQYPWLHYHLEEAELLARAATWEPPTAQQLITLLRDGTKRLLQSGEQLVTAILEALGRLQANLQGELPAAKDLWSVLPSKAYRPKDEQDLSDYVARHLDDDLRCRGVVINREVQIRRGIGDGSGQSTDIHVDAVIPGAQPGSYERIYAIVEAKGNWHPELVSAMDTQLRQRYLRENRCRHGIYLVGWFSSPKWDVDDSRKSKCPNWSVADAKTRFETQASELSVNGDYIRSYVLDVSLK
jgi:predicted NACHT family NTPase